MARKKELSRRDFLAGSTKTAAAIGVGTVLAGYGRHGGAPSGAFAAGAPPKLGANDRIRLGLIGSGGQGTNDALQCCAADNVVCVAVCDVADFRMEQATVRLAKTMEGKGHAGVKIAHHHDYRELLDREDVDAVVIATPDHWHYRPFMDAVQAGKHIYQEKPMCYTIEQGLDMVAAAKKRPELIVQIGTQRRSGTQYPEARKLIEQGAIGDIKYVRAKDCRNFVTVQDPFGPEAIAKNHAQHTDQQIDIATAKIDWDRFQEPCAHKVPFDPWRYTAWRWFWDYAGGLVTDVGVHVMDVVHWLTGNSVPVSAVCNGGVYGLEYWETPDVVHAVWDYGTHCVAFVSNFTNGFEGAGLTIFGTRGTLDVRGDDIFVYAEGKRDKPTHEIPSGGIAHQHNWINCLRSGETPNAPVDLGFSSLLPSHLANIAYRKGAKVNWDPAARKIV